MKHEMKLWDDSFNAIKEKWKTIEMRLNDEKRSLIKNGDIIQFTNTKSGEKIICKVTNVFRYKNFKELYKEHDKKSIGYKDNENAEYTDMFDYYSLEKINQYGVLAIQIETIK